MSRPSGVVSRLGAAAVVALAVLPVLGLWLGWSRPAGLVEPPPVTFDRVWPLAGRTLLLATCVSSIALVAGTWLGWMEVRGRYRGRRWLALLSMLPIAVPSYLLAAVLRTSFAPAGPLGEALGLEGRFTGFGPAVLTLSLGLTPYVQLLVGAALQRFPEAQDEAARSLGASTWRRFTTVVAPHLRPTWAFSLALVALYVIADFGAVAVLDCEVLTWELYKARGGRDAVLIGLGILALVLPVLALVRGVEGRLGSGVPSAAPAVRRWPGGRAATATYALHLGVIGMGLVLPVSALTTWVASGLWHGASFVPLAASVRDSLAYAAGGAALTTALALLPAWSAARHPGPGSRALEHMTYLASALPGVLVAFGLLQLLLALRRHPATAAGDWAALEAAGVLLLIAYALRSLATAYAAVKPAVLRLDPRQEESARSLGAGRWRRFSVLVLPAIAPGLAAAFALVFLALLKELPITLLLAPVGARTLAFRVFDAQREGSLPDVGLAGLLLLALALGAQLAVRRWRAHA